MSDGRALVFGKKIIDGFVLAGCFFRILLSILCSLLSVERSGCLMLSIALLPVSTLHMK